MRPRRILFAAGAAFAFTLATGVIAHEGAMGVVKERMEMMKDMAAAMKVIVPMMQGKNEWDANSAAESAGILADHAAKLPEKFPEGSAGQPSEARKEIWDKWEEFADSANGLAESAAAFKAAASGGADAAKPHFAEILKSCKGCHESFRLNKQ